MKKRIFSLLPVLVFGFVFFLFFGCKDEPVDWNYQAKKELNRIMHDIYYWYNQVPNVDIDNYSTPEELMDALMVNPPDKWSYVTTKKEYDAYDAGKYYGFGFSSIFDEDGKLWVGFAYKSSPFTEKGIGRGWQISKIEGVTPTRDNFSQLIGPNQAGLTKDIEFLSPEGSVVSYTLSKIEVNTNTILFDSVYNLGGKNVGYFVLNGFITPTKDELDACFSKFKSKDVNELIVDLRYNGGGSIDISRYLASLIGGATTSGKIYTTYTFNDRYTSQNKSIWYTNEPNALSLSRVTFIATNGTASASELVINGLNPFMTVSIVGSKTHGKPVGMPVFRYNEFKWVFLPICISLKNADGVGDYFNGLDVDVAALDDYTRKFGDINEASFAAALNHIGVLPVKSMDFNVKKSVRITGKGIYEEIGAW